MILFADILPEATWAAIGDSGKAILIWLTIGCLVMAFIHLFKKTFGPQPALDEQLKQIVKLLRGEIHREKNSALKEFKLKLGPVEDRVTKAETDIADIQLDRLRKWQELKEEIHTIATDVAFMRGEKKGEAHR